jgi:hypothetical protein
MNSYIRKAKQLLFYNLAVKLKDIKNNVKKIEDNIEVIICYNTNWYLQRTCSHHFIKPFILMGK